MWAKNKNATGFTIVELLIVIVVIGILAALTLVAYNGISKRAYNTQVIGGARQYYQAIQSYYATYSTYPITGPEQSGQHIAMTCLGVGYPGKYCGEVTGVGVYEDATFNQKMTQYLQSTPHAVANTNLPVPNESYTGAVYGLDSTSASSTGYGRVIEYAVHGNNANCGITGAWAYSTNSSATACEILLEEVAP